MGQAAGSTTGAPVLASEDGLGKRYQVQTGGDREVHPELLCFRPELTDNPSFESALRERVSLLSTFQHPSYIPVRRIDRLNGRTLALFSDCPSGVRLAELLVETERRGLVLDINSAMCVLQQLAPAAALLHQSVHLANGALGPERLILTPQARLVIAESAIGGALEQLHYTRERYWQDLRVALPPSPGEPKFDELADITQLGMVGLALVLGRPLNGDEYPGAVSDLVELAYARSRSGDGTPLSSGLRSWLRRALQLDARHSFGSIAEATTGLEELVANDDRYAGDMNALTAFLAAYQASSATGTVCATSDDRPQIGQPPVVSQVEATLTAPQPSVTEAETEATEAEPATATPEITPFRDRPVWSHLTITATEEPQLVTQSKKFMVNRSWIAAAAAVTAVAALLAWPRYMSSATAASNGTLTVSTNPPGAQILVDNVPRGQSPLNLSLLPGQHSVVVRGDGEPRTIPVTITAGATSSHYLDLPKAAITTGTLQIKTEPSGARVTVDGQARGNTPLTLADLEAGEHSVVLENDLGSASHSVVIQPGVPATLVVPLGAPQGAIVSGWMSVSAPIELQVYEQGRLLGSSSIDRIMLASGPHEIEIANEPLGFRMTRTIQVAPGKVSPIAVTLPKGVVSLNAIPWATVSIDGENVGETPIGNLPVTIGSHEVVFTNPQFGEQRRVINVTLKAPIRASIDFSKK
ncbi:MAG: PEGA domain-containing protein [Acidobacteria bacterium]|nr:PEGA domain-containing protein [Acidobacteriota bacterium]